MDTHVVWWRSPDTNERKQENCVVILEFEKKFRGERTTIVQLEKI